MAKKVNEKHRLTFLHCFCEQSHSKLSVRFAIAIRKIA